MVISVKRVCRLDHLGWTYSWLTVISATVAAAPKAVGIPKAKLDPGIFSWFEKMAVKPILNADMTQQAAALMCQRLNVFLSIRPLKTILKKILVLIKRAKTEPGITLTLIFRSNVMANVRIPNPMYCSQRVAVGQDLFGINQ